MEDNVLHKFWEIVNRMSTITFGLFCTWNSTNGKNLNLDILRTPFCDLTFSLPDMSLISSVWMASEGFFESEEYGMRVAQILAVCKKQFSKQCFYDFGMRKLKNVITAAGKTWTSQRGKTTEGQVLNDSLRLFIGAGLTMNDFSTFESILKSHFGLWPQKTSLKVDEYIKAAGGYTFGRWCKDVFGQKALQFSSLVKIRHGVMVIGKPGSLKRRLIEAVSGVENWNVEFVYPSSLGNYDLFVKLKSLFKGEFSEKDGMKLIVLSGDLDSCWAEGLNSLLDDNKCLRLSLSETLKLPEDFRIVLETSNVSSSTPAIISRLSAVHIWTPRSSKYPFKNTVSQKLKEIGQPAYSASSKVQKRLLM